MNTGLNSNEIKTNPGTFKKFIKQWPKGTDWWIIPIQRHSKAPDVRKGESWSNPRFKDKYCLTYKQAVRRLKNGGNVGIVCTRDVAILDIDRPDEAQKILPNSFYATLFIRSRTGNPHLYYRNRGLLNADYGKVMELRADPDNPRYVVGPGSYVYDPEDDIGGRYTIQNLQPPQELSPDDLPDELKAEKALEPKNVGDMIKHGKKLVEDNPALKKYWLEKGKKEGDKSRSGYDFSLLLKALSLGITSDVDLKALLLSKPDSKAQEQGDKYLKRTLEKARERFKETKSKVVRGDRVADRHHQGKGKKIVTIDEFQSIVNKRSKKEVDFSIDFNLTQEAYPEDGWLSHFVNYGLGVTDANAELLLAGGLATLSGSVGKLIAMPHFVGRNLYTNLWICVLAPHGRHRKSSVISLVRSFLRKVGMWNILPDEVTPEKLISEMQSHNATGTFAISEMASFLSLANRSYQGGFKPMLANWYDVPTEYAKKKKTGDVNEKEQIIRKPYITIFGGSTLEWFLESTNPTDVLGGLFSRMIFIPLTRKKREKVLWPDELSGRGSMPENELAMDLMQRVNHLRELSQDGKPVMFKVNPGTKARKIYGDWVHKVDKSVNKSADINKIAGFAERLQTAAKKVSILIEVASPGFTEKLKDRLESGETQRPFEITPKSMRLSVNFINEVWRVTKLLVERRFVHDPFARMMQKILEFVYEKGQVQRSTLLRKFHIKAKDLDDLQSTLKEAGYIDTVKVKHESSDKPTEYLIPGDWKVH